MPCRTAPLFIRNLPPCIMAVLTIACCLPGCGINPELTSEQQDRDLNARMVWVDKAIQVAERHNLAYRVEVESTGKPSIGETIDLYLNTGVAAKVMMFGNAASPPPTNDVVPNTTDNTATIISDASTVTDSNTASTKVSE